MTAKNKVGLMAYKVVYPPQKNDPFFGGGGSFFWADPLGPSNHPSTIVGCFKVV